MQMIQLFFIALTTIVIAIIVNASLNDVIKAIKAVKNKLLNRV